MSSGVDFVASLLHSYGLASTSAAHQQTVEMLAVQLLQNEHISDGVRGGHHNLVERGAFLGEQTEGNFTRSPNATFVAVQITHNTRSKRIQAVPGKPQV